MRINWTEIERLAKAHHSEPATSSSDALERYLKWWWCQKFTRPLKDPVLATYTLDELIYEFLRHLYLNPKHDPEEAERQQEQARRDEQWALQEIRKMKPPETTKDKPIKKTRSKKSKETNVPELPDISTKFE